MVRLCRFGWPRTWAGICKCWGRNYLWSRLLRHSWCYVLIRLFFSGLLHSRDLHKEEETMVFEAHGMSFPCTELLLFIYAKVKTVFHSMASLKEEFTQKFKFTAALLTLRPSKMQMNLFLHQIWRNVALNHLLTNGSSAVNGCRQNESPNSW